jgi:hypothetical protein
MSTTVICLNFPDFFENSGNSNKKLAKYVQTKNLFLYCLDFADFIFGFPGFLFGFHLDPYCEPK